MRFYLIFELKPTPFVLTALVVRLGLNLVASYANDCRGLFLIEPTTYEVMFGELAKNPYPEFIVLNEKL